MIVELREIPAEGIDLSFDLSGAFAHEALAGTEAAPESARVTARLFLSRTNRSVFARGSIEGSLELPCTRCLAAATLQVDSPFQVTYLPRPGAGDEAMDEGTPEEVELSAEDLDFATYEGEEIDLGGLLREQLLLVLPMTHLCREDCQGLCPQCGQDRNVATCECRPPSGDDRWAALRNLKL